MLSIFGISFAVSLRSTNHERVEVRIHFLMMVVLQRALHWSARFLFSSLVVSVMIKSFEERLAVLKHGKERLRIWADCR